MSADDKQLVELLYGLDNLQERLTYYWQPNIVDMLLGAYLRDLAALKKIRNDSITMGYESWLDKYAERNHIPMEYMKKKKGD